MQNSLKSTMLLFTGQKRTRQDKKRKKEKKNIYKLITRQTAEDILQTSYVVMVPMGDDYLVYGGIVVL